MHPFVTFLTIVAILSGLGGDARANDVDTGLSDVFKLNEKLPMAVCDESVVAKAPTLETLRDSRTPQLEAPSTLWIYPVASESRMISFLLGDRLTLIAAPKVAQQFTESKTTDLTALRRSISLEVCTSMVTPGKREKFLSETPSSFFSTKKIPSEVRISVHDVEGRFGSLGRDWLVAGWIENYEVGDVIVGKHTYRRIANPVTNYTRLIELVSSDGSPLGFLHPVQSDQKASTETGAETGDTLEGEANRQHLLESYRLRIESDAFFAVKWAVKGAVHGARNDTDEIRKLQDYYKSLMSAYQIYPQEKQFEEYARKGKLLGGTKDVRRSLDANFFTQLRAATVNGASATISFYTPDPVLQGMYREYQDRLKTIR